MRKQRYSVEPLGVGRNWPSAKIHVLKRKDAVKNDPKQNWSGIETEAGVE